MEAQKNAVVTAWGRALVRNGLVVCQVFLMVLGCVSAALLFVLYTVPPYDLICPDGTHCVWGDIRPVIQTIVFISSVLTVFVCSCVLPLWDVE